VIKERPMSSRDEPRDRSFEDDDMGEVRGTRANLAAEKREMIRKRKQSAFPRRAMLEVGYDDGDDKSEGGESFFSSEGIMTPREDEETAEMKGAEQMYSDSALNERLSVANHLASIPEEEEKDERKGKELQRTLQQLSLTDQDQSSSVGPRLPPLRPSTTAASLRFNIVSEEEDKDL